MRFHRAGLLVTILPLILAANGARADCLWDVGMAEQDLAGLERAAPLAADRSLPLGPGGPDRFSGSERDLAERSSLAYGEGGGGAADGTDAGGIIEGRIVWARDRLEVARTSASRGDMDACAAALEQARTAISGARSAFRQNG
jgi:hypothetical protein